MKKKSEIHQREKSKRMALELYCLEGYLQWLQVQRQQCLNLKFARPVPFSEGELAAFNRAIVHLEQLIHHQHENLTDYFNAKRESL